MMNLKISALHTAYANGETTPTEIVEQLLAEMEKAPKSIWIAKSTKESLAKYLNNLRGHSPKDMPLYGIPFAIKDNIDCEGFETTAACPAYAYKPFKSAFVVDKLIRSGAIPMGKTNMDQFATGLVGVRSPYGAIPNKFNNEYISGGSSSGSAAALAYGLCSFSLGTDTAGSGRIPAAFNKLIGVKPTCGILSIEGVVPACKSLDCISIFAHDLNDAETILDVVAVENKQDAYSKNGEGHLENKHLPSKWTFGIPQKCQLNFFGNEAFATAFDKAVAAAEMAGGEKIEIDFSPFLDAARLLYEGPFVFERYAAVGKFIEENGNKIHPVTRSIITPKVTPHPADVFAGFHKLREKKKRADNEISKVDFIITPTAGTIYKTAEVQADPIQLNSNLGYYTNYMNLLDYCALAIPAGMSKMYAKNDLPFGITLVAPAFGDKLLMQAAAKISKMLEDQITIAVCGAHLKGCPLHNQLADAEFLGSAETAAEYRMYAFKDTTSGIEKPAMVRIADATNTAKGCKFYVELYSLNKSAFGEFVANIPAPLGIGKIHLSDDREVCGFIGESYIVNKAKDISEYGDWRKYLKT